MRVEEKEETMQALETIKLSERRWEREKKEEWEMKGRGCVVFPLPQPTYIFL